MGFLLLPLLLLPLFLSPSSLPLVRIHDRVHHGPERQRPERLPPAEHLGAQDREAEDVGGPADPALRDDLGRLVGERAVRVRGDVGEGRVGGGGRGDGGGEGEGDRKAAAAGGGGGGGGGGLAASAGCGGRGGRQDPREAKVADLADVSSRVRGHGLEKDLLIGFVGV